MNTFDWEKAIREWSRKKIDALEDYYKEELPPDILESGYFGCPGATDEQIANAENYLGMALPPSYKEFLKISNGLRPIPELGIEFYSADEIGWYAYGDEKWIQDVIDIWQDTPVTDEEYFVYGDEQCYLAFRPEYIKTAVFISSEIMGYGFLLNPKIVFPDGEWEAWFCSFNSDFWMSRYRSFREMMEIILSEPEFI